MEQQPKKPLSRFKPGQSGNPKGRPRGEVTATKLRKAIADRVPEILDSLMTQALEQGDVQAAKLLLERALPPLKPAEPLQRISIPNGGTLSDQGRAVLGAVASGTLAPGQGSQLISAIGALARVAEVEALAERVKALEDVGVKWEGDE